MKSIKSALKLIVLLPLIPFIPLYILYLGLEVSFAIEVNGKGKGFSYEKAQENVMPKFKESVIHEKAVAYSLSLALWAIIAYFIVC